MRSRRKGSSDLYCHLRGVDPVLANIYRSCRSPGVAYGLASETAVRHAASCTAALGFRELERRTKISWLDGTETTARRLQTAIRIVYGVF
jgi:hypothetical protein